MQRTDKLAVSCYAKHGDMCSNAPHCESLGCASGLASEDYVLVAKFAYLQEAIDYCLDGTKCGVNMRLVSRICKPLFTREYAPQAKTERELGYPLMDQIHGVRDGAL